MLARAVQRRGFGMAVAMFVQAAVERPCCGGRESSSLSRRDDVGRGWVRGELSGQRPLELVEFAELAKARGPFGGASPRGGAVRGRGIRGVLAMMGAWCA